MSPLLVWRLVVSPEQDIPDQFGNVMLFEGPNIKIYCNAINGTAHKILILMASASSEDTNNPSFPHSLVRAFTSCTHKV